MDKTASQHVDMLRKELMVKRNSMAEALSQAAGHAYSRPPASEVPESRQAPLAITGPDFPRSTTAPSRIGKKPITGFFDPAVSRQLKKLGADRDHTIQDLLQEALNDIFRKYDLPPIA